MSKSHVHGFGDKNNHLRKRSRGPGGSAGYLEALETRALLSAYFVSAAGSDNGAGTAADPWQTLQKAANSVQAGDVVTVGAGTYAGFNLSSAHTGTATNRITFDADPGVLINTRNTKTPDAINLEGASYVTIDGFSINNDLGTITRGGIRAVTDQGVIIRNNTVDGAGDWNIFTGFSDDVLIENNIASHARTQHGIYVSNSGDRPVIRGNTVFGNHNCGIHMNGDASEGGDGIISNALVEDNIIYDNCANGGSAINADGVQDSIFRNNLLYDNHASGISLFSQDGAAGSTGNIVSNNTIILPADGRWCVNIANASIGNQVIDNILDNRNTGRGAITVSTDSMSGFSSDYNVVINNRFTPDGRTNMTLSQWQATTGQDSHSQLSTEADIFANASVDDYRLFSGSAAVDAGTAVSGTVADLLSDPRPAGGIFDAGAYEWADGPTVPITVSDPTPPASTVGGTTPAPISPPPAGQVQVSLNGRFNTTGIYTPDTTFYKRAGLDQSGDAYSATLLGTSITAGGSTFTLRPGEMTNVVSATGQTVSLPKGSFSTLTFLGGAVDGSQNGTFIVNYSDGSSQSYSQTLSDWSASAAAPGETLAKSMDSYVLYNGQTVQRTTNLYAYQFALTAGKRAVSITLPKDSDIKILAMDLVA